MALIYDMISILRLLPVTYLLSTIIMFKFGKQMSFFVLYGLRSKWSILIDM